MKFLKSLILIINYKTLIIIAVSVISTYLCEYYKVTADFPLTLISVSVVFPIVFSIGGAYTRRENALKYYGSMKAHGRALFFASRDWIPGADDIYEIRLKKILGDMFISCRDYFHSNTEEKDKFERHVYSLFTEISIFINEFRDRGLPSGEVSRTNQYLSKIIDAFESMKHIYQYRTPRTLRAYSKMFVVLVPVVYAPYFAHLGLEIPMWLSFVMPIMFSLSLVSLDNIQEHLENPFDQIGEDDITINAEKFTENLELLRKIPSETLA